MTRVRDDVGEREPTVEVALPSGTTVDIPLLWDVPDAPRAVVVLAHGAGAGPDHPFLAGFAAALCASGLAVARFAFPYVIAGRRMPGPVAHATAAWDAVLPAVARAVPGVPVVAAGKSYGGRMASLAAAAETIAPAALLYLGYPLHPPGRPDRLRAEHLPAIAAPQLFVSGTRDAFVQPIEDLEAAVAACSRADILWIEGATHAFEVAGHRRSADVIGAGIAADVLPWLRAIRQPPM